MNLIIKLKAGKNIDDIMNGVSQLKKTLPIKRLHSLECKLQAQYGEQELAAVSEEQIRVMEEEILNTMEVYERAIYQTYILTVSSSEDLPTIQQQLSLDENVVYVEEDEINEKPENIDPNHNQVMPTNSSPTNVKELYGLKLMQVVEAWRRSKGEGVIVAVVDTGVDYEHPGIKANMWRNANGEFGYDFINNRPNAKDDNGHGTHVAGTIAAVEDPSIQVVGVAPKAQIMAVKGLDSAGRGTASALSKCIKYAVDNGAKIINNSWGPAKAQAIKDVINYAYAKGCINVFAAGNAGLEVTADTAAGSDKVIAVAATDSNDEKAYFSNYGELVNVSAPGVRINSLAYNSIGYEKLSGTSMACPHVAGELALLVKLDSSLSFEQLRTKLSEAVDPSTSTKPIGSGRVNAKKAVASIVGPISPIPYEDIIPAHFVKIIAYTVMYSHVEKLSRVILKLNLETEKVVQLEFKDIVAANSMVWILEKKDCYADRQGNILCY